MSRSHKGIKFKKQKNRKNGLLTENLLYSGVSDLPTQLELIQYNASGIDISNPKTVAELTSKLKKDHVCWLIVTGMKDIKLIAEIKQRFSLHILEIQDVLNVEHIPKVEEYENNTLLLTKALYVDENQELNREQLAFILGKNFLITFQETANLYFDDVKTALHEKAIKARQRSADYLLSLLLRSICDSYTFYIDQIEDALEELETKLMEFSKDETDVGWDIQSLRRQYLQLKKTVMPLKDSFSHLLHGKQERLNTDDAAYLNDTFDHLQMVAQKLDVCREIISSLLDMYVSNNDLRMNDIMKQLTVVGTIFIPLTFVVGVWGMNFSFMPELNWKYGYLFAWIVIIIIGVGCWLYFKRKKWY